MNLLGPSLIFAVLFAIGYFPMQRLKSKRAAVISALLGLALVPIGLVLLRAFPASLNNLSYVVFVFWMMLVGAAMVLGSGTRHFILSQPGYSRRDRQLVTGLLAVALGSLLIVVLRALGGA